jgi:sugar lactone lactonase YvrE
MAYKTEMIADFKTRVGEGPVWDPKRQILNWTDIQTGRLFEYDPSTGKSRKIYQGEYIGGYANNKQGGFVVASWSGIGLWREGEEITYIHQGALHGMPLQFNDVTAGPGGQFYAGTYYEDGRRAKLYMFDPDGGITIVQEDIGTSNGLGFSPDLSTSYYVDTQQKRIWAYDFDAASGAFSNRRDLILFEGEEGFPDGMTVDSEGFIWQAMWGGGCVIRIDPDGKEERRVRFPATQTSSAMFGGKDLNELYVTTAWNGTGENSPGTYDGAAHRGGELYRVKLDVQGKAEFETDFAWPE